MFRTATTTIGIVLSAGGIKIVELDTTTRPFKVIDYVNESYHLEGENVLASQLRSILTEKRYTGRKVNIALPDFPDSTFLHKVITLPRMSKKEMRIVLQREAKKEALSSSEIVHDGVLLKTVEEKGVQKNRVLMVIAPRKEIDDNIAFWREVGVEPQLFTTFPLALLHSLSMCNSELQKEIVAFLYLELFRISMIIVDQGTFEFSRNFILNTTPKRDSSISYLSEGTEEAARELLDREYIDLILTEINRSFLYYKHQNRGKTVERIMLGGEVTYLENLKSALKERVEQKVDIFLPITTLDASALGIRQQAFQKLLPSLAISLGLCERENNQNKINLLPQEVREQKRLLLSRAIMGTACAVLFLSLFIGYVCFLWGVHTQQKVLFKQQVAWGELAPLVTNLTEVERERKQSHAQSLVLNSFLHSETLWRGLFKSLSILVPDEMLFHRLEAKKKEGGYQIEIQGEVVADSAASAQALFNQFYHAMEQSPFFKNSNNPTIRLSPYVETIGTNPDPGSINLKWNKKDTGRVIAQSVSKLDFEIRTEYRGK